MSKYITLQVADTRFAVRCSYPSFMRWLGESYPGFISHEEPHLWLNVKLNGVPQDESQLLSITTKGGNNGHVNLEMSVAYVNLADFFWPALHFCLRCAIAVKQPPDLLLHSAGIVREGMAYLFPGPSGAGKSTLCTLLANNSAYTILHDDIVALSQKEGGFYAWSTPPREDFTTKQSVSAPLRAIFFLKQNRTNYATRLSIIKSAGSLFASLIPPHILINGRFVFKPAESLKLALELAEAIPCYELHFRPEHDFWECIPPLFEKESAITPRKG